MVSGHRWVRPKKSSSRKEQIKVGQDQIDAKSCEFGSTVEKLTEFEEGLEDPEELLGVLKEKCFGIDAGCKERQHDDLLTQTCNPASCRPRLWSDASTLLRADLHDFGGTFPGYCGAHSCCRQGAEWLPVGRLADLQMMMKRMSGE